jgi:hypothetical protein
MPAGSCSANARTTAPLWNVPRAVTTDRSLKATPQPEAGERGFGEVLDNWLPLTYALNAVNRSMGLDDLYPFTLAEPVIEKLRFVHGCVQKYARPLVG